MTVPHKYKLSGKIIIFCGDECNTNSGRAAWRGTIFFANAKDPQFKKKNIRDIECAILSGIQSCLQLLKDGPKYSSLK